MAAKEASFDITSEISLEEVKNVRQYGELVSGIDKENAKKINLAIKNAGLKVKSQIQEDQIRVTGKNRDDLQKVIALLKTMDLPIQLQFTN